MRALATMLAVAFAGLGCGAQPAAETWRFAIEEIEGSVQHAYAEALAERVRVRTAGAVDVAIYPYGTLGTSAQLTEQVQRGALELSFASPGHLGSVIPEVQVFSLHFALSDDEAANQRLLASRGRFREILDEAYRGQGLELLALVSEGWMAWTANRPLRTPEDMRGLKMRTMVSPLLLEAYAAYGATPTPLPYGEVYSALQLEMIDAQVNPVFAIEEMSFHEVQDYLMLANHALFVTSVVASPRFLAGLTPARRAMLDAAIGELDRVAFETQRALNRQRLARIREQGGTTIVELDAAQREAFRAKSRPVRERFLELAGPRGAELLDALNAERTAAEAASARAHEADTGSKSRLAM